MHEMSLVRPVLDYVLQKGEECGARAVLSVRLTIGDAHDVVEELIPGCFATWPAARSPRMPRSS